MMQSRARGIADRKRVSVIKQKHHRDSKAVVALQARARGQQDRRNLVARKNAAMLPGQERLAVRVQARARGKSARRLVDERQSAGLLPGQMRMAASAMHPALPVAAAVPEAGAPPPAPLMGAALSATEAAYAEPAYAAEAVESAADSSFWTENEDENESVDSDYDYEDSAFEELGNELLAGKLTSAKVYGQEEPPPRRTSSSGRAATSCCTTRGGSCTTTTCRTGCRWATAG